MAIQQLTRHSYRGGCRGYDSEGERAADIAGLQAIGFDYFTTYRDAQAPIALSYGRTPENELAYLDEKETWRPLQPCEEKRRAIIMKIVEDRRKRDRSTPPRRNHGWMVGHPGYDPVH